MLTPQTGLLAQARLGLQHNKPILKWFGSHDSWVADAHDSRVGGYQVYENGHGKFTARRNFGLFHSSSMKLSESLDTLEQALAICRRHQMDMLADPRNTHDICKQDKENSYEYNEAVDRVGHQLD